MVDIPSSVVIQSPKKIHQHVLTEKLQTDIQTEGTETAEKRIKREANRVQEALLRARKASTIRKMEEEKERMCQAQETRHMEDLHREARRQARELEDRSTHVYSNPTTTINNIGIHDVNIRSPFGFQFRQPTFSSINTSTPVQSTSGLFAGFEPTYNIRASERLEIEPRNIIGRPFRTGQIKIVKI